MLDMKVLDSKAETSCVKVENGLKSLIGLVQIYWWGTTGSMNICTTLKHLQCTDVLSGIRLVLSMSVP